MGIKGLHTRLKPSVRSCSARSYAGKRVAVDTYGWIYKALCNADAAKACIQNGDVSRAVRYVERRVEMLKGLGVTAGECILLAAGWATGRGHVTVRPSLCTLRAPRCRGALP